MRKNAVTFGRYNVFSLGHLSTIKEILKSWEHLHILVIDSELPKNNELIPTLCEFYALCDKNHTKNKNVFNTSERLEFIKRACVEAGIIDRITIGITCRPEYNYDYFNFQYPKSKFDLVFPECSEDSKFDKLRNVAFEKILNRKVFDVKAPVVMHLSDIVEKLNNNSNIKSFFLSSVVQYLKDINGLERLAKYYGK